MSRLGLCLTLSVGLAIGIVFAVDPSLDLRVARFFHNLEAAGVPDSVRAALVMIRELNLYFVVGLIVCSATALVTQVRRERAAPVPSVRASALVLLAIAVGPGLIVNAALKEHWSRPRPGVVLAAGDETQFRAWWDPSGSCRRNCSFASGEAAAAFTTLAIAVVSPLGWRYTAVTLALVYGSLVGATRVAVGGHFVSDVVFAGVIAALVVWMLHGLIYRWPATRVSEEEARNWLVRSTIRLQRQSRNALAAIRRAPRRSAVRRPADAMPAPDGSHRSSAASA